MSCVRVNTFIAVFVIKYYFIVKVAEIFVMLVEEWDTSLETSIVFNIKIFRDFILV
jgi:hypothetical protein